MDVSKLRAVYVTYKRDHDEYVFMRDRLTDLWYGDGDYWSNAMLEEYLKTQRRHIIVKGYE